MQTKQKCTRCGKLTPTKSMVWMNDLLQCVRCTIGESKRAGYKL